MTGRQSLRLSSLFLLVVGAISLHNPGPPPFIECPAGFDQVAGSNTCFILLKEGGKTTWAGAQQRCLDAGLRLAAPSNTIAVKLRKLLFNKYGDQSTAWVSAKGGWLDNNEFAWQPVTRSFRTLPCDHQLMEVQTCYFATSTDCLYMVIIDRNIINSPGTPYSGWTCNWYKAHYALCQQD